MSTHVKGYLLGVIAAATYGMIPLFTLPLLADGMDAVSILFFRYLLAIPLLGAMLRLRGRSFSLPRTAVWLLAGLGVIMSVSSVTLFMSYHYMASSLASTLLFVYPIMVAVIMALFFKEKFTLQTFVCIVMALCGIWLLHEGAPGGHLDPRGSALVFLSALSYACYIVLVNRPRLHRVPTLKVTFYILLFGLWPFLAVLLFQGHIALPQHWYLWGNLIALAVFPTAVSFLCTTSAIQYIGSTPTAILGAIEPLTAVFFGLTIFGDQLTTSVAIGLVLIILAVTLVVTGGRTAQWLLRFRKLFPRLPMRRRLWRR